MQISAVQGGFRMTAKEVAKWFLSQDENRTVFTKKLINKNGRTFYEGNARLNKYLHLAQNIYIAKTGCKLFEDSLYAYDNGAVVPQVQENFSIYLNKKQCPDIPKDIAAFLRKIYLIFQNATLDELIELSHEDHEWSEKSGGYYRNDQIMDSLKYADEYTEQYEDILRIMEGMTV